MEVLFEGSPVESAPAAVMEGGVSAAGRHGPGPSRVAPNRGARLPAGCRDEYAHTGSEGGAARHRGGCGTTVKGADEVVRRDAACAC